MANVRILPVVLRVGCLLLALSVAACGSMQNTPRQTYTYEMAEGCKHIQDIKLDRVEPDGRYWYFGSPSQWNQFQQCMGAQMKLHPYFDWIKAQPAVPQSTGRVAMSAPPAAAPVSLGPIMVPVWNIGDEWQFAYKSPSDSGAYVWSVNRVEMLDGVQHYVIKTGTREIFYRVSDLASSLERVDGVIVSRDTPSRLNFSFPLAVGKIWEQSNRQERPIDRTSTDRNSLWTVEAEETVTVPAGTFRTIRITWRNKNTGALLYEMWVAPDVKQWVKIREILSNGQWERELTSFKLK